MGLFKQFVSQTRKPEGFLGKLMVGSMNGGHAKLADWGMSHLNGIKATSIAELGCGGGRNASELLKYYPQAKLTAMDYSEVSVQKAKETNKALIAAGRCTVVFHYLGHNGYNADKTVGKEFSGRRAGKTETEA